MIWTQRTMWFGAGNLDSMATMSLYDCTVIPYAWKGNVRRLLLCTVMIWMAVNGETKVILYLLLCFYKWSASVIDLGRFTLFIYHYYYTFINCYCPNFILVVLIHKAS